MVPFFKRIILKDLIELDTYGYSDHSIELSSDEEEAPGDGVSWHEVKQRKVLALSYDAPPAPSTWDFTS